jgi:competence protein ComEC
MIVLEKENGRWKHNVARRGLLVFVALSSIVAISWYYISTQRLDLEWIMIDVNHSKQQADAHFITVRNGKTILIDAGHRNTATKVLLPFLKEKLINEIDTVFISHPHVDHYGGLDILLDNDIKIKEVYFNIPDKATCDKEIPWGCDYNEVLSLHKKLRDKGVVIKVAKAGKKYNLGNHTWIELLYAFDGVTTPVGKTDINDLSLIMMLHHNKYKFLFTGDMNHKIGSYLAKSSGDISADVLKVPHHGTETVAPNIFFKKVAPQYALVPAPEYLWLSNRSKRIRNWFKNNNVPVFVNGISGNIRVAVTGKGLTVNAVKNIEDQ